MTNKRNFYDFSNFTDPIEALEAFHNAIRVGMDFNGLPGPVFLAKVLNTPIPLDASQISAIVGTRSNANDKKMITVKFKGRIEQLHSFLDDPCELAYAENPTRVRTQEADHTDFVGTLSLGDIPAAGDIVEVQLAPGANGAWNLQYGRCLGIFQPNGAAATSSSRCRNGRTAFNINEAAASFGNFPPGGGSARGMPTPEIEECAARYDENENIPLKGHNDSRISSLHASFQPYVKCFITRAYEDDITIQINNTYRTMENQQSKYDAWLAKGKEGIRPATPGTSYHEYGLAFDFNPITSKYQNGISSTMDKEIWIESGVVAIGEEVGLNWGGDFSGNYDPIHFDAKDIIRKGTSELKSLASTQGVAGNQLAIG